MNDNATEDKVEDLGAASELTRGIWDPMLKENYVHPESWDM